MKIWKKLLLATSTFASVVSVPVLLASCSSSASSNDQHISEYDELETSVMVASGTNSITMSALQNSYQQQKFESAKSEFSSLLHWNSNSTEQHTEYGFKFGLWNSNLTFVSGKSGELREEALKIEDNQNNTNQTNNIYYESYYEFWNKVATEYKTQNIGYLFVSKDEFLNKYKTSYITLLSIFGLKNQNTSNDYQLYSTFISDYLSLASIKEEFLIYAYYRKIYISNDTQSPLLSYSKSLLEAKYKYFLNNIKKEVNGFWFLVDYAFSKK